MSPIVFIHGLSGDRRASWTAEGADAPWPQTLLPEVLPEARVITIGYEARVIGWKAISKNRIQDHAETLLCQLAAHREKDDTTERPIFFVAHSLGGVVLKDVLLLSWNNPEAHLKKIGYSTRGIMFLGTPHSGSSLATRAEPLARYINHFWPTNATISAVLRPDSEVLARIQANFLSELRRLERGGSSIKITCFYEEKDSPGFGRIVRRDSAVIHGYTSRSINKNHEDMSKFKDPDDPGFVDVSGELQIWSKFLQEYQTNISDVLRLTQSHPAAEPKALLVSSYSEAIRKECSRSLTYSTMDNRYYSVDQPHSDTCKWIFETEQVKSWLDRKDINSNNALLWIKGNPGVGKSTLLKYVLVRCKETYHSHIFASYFFNARGAPMDKTALGMIRSLVHQLVDNSLTVRNSFIPRYLKREGKFREKVEWDFNELQDFMLDLMKHFEGAMFLFIDALDECEDIDASNVVKLIETLSDQARKYGTRLNICLSSRHYPNIDTERKIKLVVEKIAEHNDDITVYVQDKLRVQDVQMKQQLLEKANGIFMWVILVVQLLNSAFDQGDLQAMRQQMEDVPRDLDGLFSLMLERDNKHIKETVLMFQWMLFKQQRLCPEGLYAAVLAASRPKDLQLLDKSEHSLQIIKNFITRTSRGLIEIKKPPQGKRDHTQFIHQTVDDFLIRNKRLQQLDPSLEGQVTALSHDRLVDCCISYIMQDEWDWPKIKDLNDEELDSRHPLLLYVKEHVFEHFHEALIHSDMPYKVRIQEKFLKKFFGDVELSRRILKPPSGGLYSDLYFSHDAELLNTVSAKGFNEMVQILIDAGANVNAQSGKYGNALQAAAACGYTETVRILLAAGANVNAQGGQYGNALQAAAAFGYTETVRILLAAGANVNAQGGGYGNALQAAATYRSAGTIRMLLDAGANVNAQGGQYGNALMAGLRSQLSMPETVSLLIVAGIDVVGQGGPYADALLAAGFDLGRIKEVMKLARSDWKSRSVERRWY
ncbi:MAG: hypothetical protein M1814_005052 [Vezdaea aestivalis]|nr:MAG: hypothetical protein M1814_005052 [Vezdaea aestivalis]